MKILFAVGVGILPEQRVERWKMVSKLYSHLGHSFRQLGHQIYFYVHPDALIPEIPQEFLLVSSDHNQFQYLLDTFVPDYTFCWNGSSAGDVTTSTFANMHNSKMIFSEQGWFPQKSTIYFDFQGCNAKSSFANTEYPPLTAKQEKTFISERKVYIDGIDGQNFFNVNEFKLNKVDLNKPIFVPLQDERDLNIVQDSPFKTMNSFLGFLSTKYPDNQFIARPHPKYPNPYLDDYPNIVLDNPKVPMFETLTKCGLVIGINSTTLQESALLGFPVLSFGKSLATGTGIFHDADDKNYPHSLLDLRFDIALMESALYQLLCVRQFKRDSLGKPEEIMKSWFFKELVKLSGWNKIYR